MMYLSCFAWVLYCTHYYIISFDIICVYYSFTHDCWLWSGGLPGLTAPFARRCVESCKMCSWRTAKRRCRGKLHIGAIRSLFRTYSACWSGLWSVVLTRFDTDWAQGDRWQLSPTWQRAHCRFLALLGARRWETSRTQRYPEPYQRMMKSIDGSTSVE